MNTDRKALWAVRESGLPAVVKPCMDCSGTRHHPSGRFRVNANGKLLDVWLLLCCAWTGTWELETDTPFCPPDGPAPLRVLISFELPAPVRVERLLTLGLGLSRAEVRRMVADGRIRLPLALDAKAHQDFEFTVDGGPVPTTSARPRSPHPR